MTKQTYIHFSSANQEWETPRAIFDLYNATYHFTLDVCATQDNAKVAQFFTKHDDGLSKEWTGVCWMNPPYGRDIKRWVRKAYVSSQQGCVVVCLLPARTDTAWWHDYCMHGHIEFLRGRLKFVGANNSAPFPSAIVIFGDKKNTP